MTALPARLPQIWIVDDSPLDARLAVQALAAEFACETFADGAAALERLAAGADPDVVVLDWVLAGMSGLEICRFVRTTRDEVSLPILLLTANRESADVVEGLSAGANDYVSKPYVAAELAARVKTLARMRLLREALHQTEDRQRRMLEASGAGLWELEAATGDIASDRRMVELMGLPEGSAFTLASGLQTLPAEDRVRVEAAVRAALAGENEGRYHTEFRTGGRDGAPLRWVESRAAASFGSDGKATRLAGAMIEVTGRKQAELEREGLLEAIAAQPMLRVCVVKGPDLVFQSANDAYVKHVAHGLDVVGKRVMEVLPELRGQGFEEILHRAMTTGEAFVATEMTSPIDEGTGALEERFFSIVAQPIRAASGAFESVLVIAHDVTDGVRTRMALQSSQGRLREIFDQAPAAICLLEGAQHRFVLANPRYRKLLGEREVLGRSVLEAFPEVAEQGFVALLDEVRRSGVPYVGTETWLKIQRAEGRGPLEVCLNFVYHPIRTLEGTVDSIFVHAVDVTDMVRARESAERLAGERKSAYDVLEHGDPAVILDAEWSFTFANEAWLKLAHLAREDVIGKSHWDVFPATLDPSRKYLEGYHRAMRDRVPVQFTDCYEPLDLWTAISAYPTMDGGLAVFVRDVTQERRLEAEARSRADFERQLIGIVSHDLRNPLSNILLGIQLLLRQESLDGKTLRTLLRMQSSAQRGSHMVRDLLDFTQARLGGGIPVAATPGNLHTAVREVIEELATTAPERDINVATSGDGHGKWDMDRISQVLQNLLSNALKYSPPTSIVHVRSEGDAEGVTVSVRNEGEPIAQEALGRIFQPLQRATSQLENTTRSVGLGLFIVKQLVEAHGGTLVVASTRESGTRFTFWVPKASPPRPATPDTAGDQ